MDAKLKKKWVKALRSGEYRQTKGRLIRRDKGKVGFCCLGVLRAICPAVGGGKDKEGGILPIDSAKAVGISRAQQMILAKKNDKGIQFPAIADYIEKHL